MAAEGNFGVNQPYIKALRFVCAVADRNYQLPTIPIPEGMQLLIRGWWANANVIYITGQSSQVNQIDSSYPLLANEVIMLRVQDASCIYVAAAAAGESVSLLVESDSRYG